MHSMSSKALATSVNESLTRVLDHADFLLNLWETLGWNDESGCFQGVTTPRFAGERIKAQLIKLILVRLSKVRFDRIVLAKKDQGKAMPLSDIADCPMMFAFDDLLRRAGVASSEDFCCDKIPFVWNGPGVSLNVVPLVCIGASQQHRTATQSMTWNRPSYKPTI